jgi:hypothetical protein
MGTVTKIAMGMIGVAAIATLVLPGRQTPAVLTGFTKLFTGSLSTAQGTSTGAVG